MRIGSAFIGRIGRAIGMHADRIDEIAHARLHHLAQEHAIVNRIDLVIDARYRRRTADDDRVGITGAHAFGSRL